MSGLTSRTSFHAFSAYCTVSTALLCVMTTLPLRMTRMRGPRRALPSELPILLLPDLLLVLSQHLQGSLDLVLVTLVRALPPVVLLEAVRHQAVRFGRTSDLRPLVLDSCVERSV